MRWLGGGELYLEASDYTRVVMTPAIVDLFKPLLESQDYIHSVEFHTGQEVGVDLNAFRLRMRENHRRETLVQMQLRSHGVPESELDKPWIKVSPRKTHRVIVNLTERYRNPQFPWRRVYDKYGAEMGFVGTEKEHSLFVQNVGTCPKVETVSLLDLAQVIAGSELFVGNQSLPLALAHAMHHPTVCEMSRTGIDGWHRTINCVGTAGATIELPNLCRAKLPSAVTSRLHSALATALTWARAATQ